MFNSTMPYTMNVVPANGNGGFGGFGDGSWAWLIIIFALLFGWGGNGFGGYGGQGAMQNYILNSDFATIQRELSDGFNSIDNALDAQNNGICNLGYTQLQLANQTNTAIMQGNNALASQLATCCCENKQAIAETNYNLATQNCATLQAIDKLGDRLENKFDSYIAQNLRDENQALKLSASQSMQNQYLINALRPMPVPSFNVGYNPYNYGYGFGFGGTTIA